MAASMLYRCSQCLCCSYRSPEAVRCTTVLIFGFQHCAGAMPHHGPSCTAGVLRAQSENPELILYSLYPFPTSSNLLRSFHTSQSALCPSRQKCSARPCLKWASGGHPCPCPCAALQLRHAGSLQRSGAPEPPWVRVGGLRLADRTPPPAPPACRLSCLPPPAPTAHHINPRPPATPLLPCCSCTAQPRRQQHQAAAAAAAAATQPEAPSALLALSSLLLASPALAEDAAPDAAAAVGTPSAAGWAIALSPLIFYGLFSVYRSQINPKAKFGDAVFGEATGLAWAGRGAPSGESAALHFPRRRAVQPHSMPSLACPRARLPPDSRIPSPRPASCFAMLCCSACGAHPAVQHLFHRCS